MVAVAVRAMGRPVLVLARQLAQIFDLLVVTWTGILLGRLRIGQLVRQVAVVGYGSQGVVIWTGSFTGAVFSAQSYFKFKDFGIESTVGGLVAVAMCRELGPVLVGLMVAGRVGAAMAAEIGTMKVSEQIDALRALAVHPADYLVAPRLLAMMISMPLLIAESIGFGIAASYAVTVGVFDVSGADFWKHTVYFAGLENFFIGMLKGFVFGVIIVLVACHQGLIARDGAVGVGRGTTAAVVQASLTILVVNFFLTFFLNFFFPLGSAM
jgi:phospholipid/cholesterol/gamma-HCH transport system permease protein